LAIALPVGDSRVNALQQALRNWARQSPAEATAFAEKELPPGADRDRTVREAVRMWAENEPQAALAWMAVRPEAKPDELRGVLQSWSSQDPTAALAWARQQPEGPARGAYLAGALGGLAAQNPQEAAGM